MGLLSTIFGIAPKPAPKAATSTDTSTDVIQAIVLRLPTAPRLSILKMTYLVQVVHLGRHGTRLIPDWFRATALGVYDESLSRTCRRCLHRARYDHARLRTPSLSPAAQAIVDEVCDAFGYLAPGTLVAATTMPEVAWWSLWQPDAYNGMSISDPRRFHTYRRPCDQGPIIDVTHMMRDYRMLTTPKEMAA